MFTKEHTAKMYDQDLEDIRKRVLFMGGLVENQIGAALAAFCESNVDKADCVYKEDYKVNALEVAIDLECSQIIARRQPAAVDLRMLMGISKIVTDLERSGDEAAKIARMTRKIYGCDTCPCLRDVREMGSLAIRMLCDAINAFSSMDAVEAANIVREDLELDVKFKGIIRQLITFVMEDHRIISSAMEVMFIVKGLERIGDHAKNIAEQVIYIIRGTDVRHVSLDRLELEAKGNSE